jgi:N-acetylmuramoyl-L-alanine amidase
LREGSALRRTTGEDARHPQQPLPLFSILNSAFCILHSPLAPAPCYTFRVRKWWEWGFLVVFLGAAIPVSAATPPAGARPSASSSDVDASLTADYEIEVTVKAHRGDAWTRLAKRVTGDASHWEEIAAQNGGDDNLRHDQKVRIPFELLKPELQAQVIRSLFPNDAISKDGWKHTVVGSRGIEGESLWKIAEWFTGDGGNYSEIRKANPRQGLSTRKGDSILVPRKLLTAAFGGEMEGRNAPKASAEVRQSENDPDERAPAHEDVPEAVEMVVPVGQPSLTYDRSKAAPHAVYRLQKGEALYSSVAIRFTGRVYAKDVGDVLDRIVKFNNIEDVSRIPVGYPVKIPMELLLPEYLPSDDPQRLARESTIRESTRLATRTRARGLAGVHVIIDAGHGGRDVGTLHEGVAESAYVYDVAMRLMRVLEEKSAARVSVTTRSKSIGFKVSDRDELDYLSDHSVLTTPRYDLEDAVIGVNLRWYLANSLYRATINGGGAKEKVVFISIHADSLHPSLRGAMAYIPGAGYVKGSYQKQGDVYLARAEVRERPVVKQSAQDALLAEGLSREFAESVITSLRRADLKVHPFNPVRDNVVRGGREWVPAVIRHNVIPTRMLLEICNLGNTRDRELIQTRKYRQQVADAVYAGIGRFFEEQRDDKPAPIIATRAR